MDWQKGMNQALDYIENNLASDIDFSTLSKIVSCSEWEFRRMFSLFSSIPLSEYIRCRRLTVAAENIRNGEKIIDDSAKYGYEWQTDLERTFRRISSYLKDNGIFIFSWSHPIHKCVAYENDCLYFKKNYFDESWYSVNLDGGTLCLADRKLSTYINALAQAGFVIEELVEESDEDIVNSSQSNFAKKAQMIPATFVIKARKGI